MIKISSTIGDLSRSLRHTSHLKSIDELNHEDISNDISIIREDDAEYKLILDSNRLLQDIDDEIFSTFRYHII